MSNVITTQPTAQPELNETPPLEQTQMLENPEEKRKKKEIDNLSESIEDCCCYFDEDAFILLRCISHVCRCFAMCTDQCCNDCGDCLQNCCEGNTNGNTDTGGNDGGGEACDCWGSSSGCGNDDYDCGGCDCTCSD